ncbi:MAG: fibronectin type III domain-containing protein [Magnetococcus sp. YQC-5]
MYLLSILIFFLLASPLKAETSTIPPLPSDPGSALYTLEDLYNRLNSGANGVKRTGPFVRPDKAPDSTGHTLDDIMNKAPLPDNAHGGTAADVLCGRIFWGLRTDGTWGEQTGTALPCPPGKVQVTDPLNGQLTLAWEPPVGATAFNLYVATQAGVTKDNYSKLPGGMLKENISNPYTLTKLTNDVTYHLLVSAVGPGGEGFARPVTSTPKYARFVSNKNGTVTDIETKLILLQNANCFGDIKYSAAIQAAQKLEQGQCGLTDHSTAGQWRMPDWKAGELDIILQTRISGVFENVQSWYWGFALPEVGVLPYANFLTRSVMTMSRDMYIGTNFDHKFLWPVRNAQ